MSNSRVISLHSTSIIASWKQQLILLLLFLLNKSEMDLFFHNLYQNVTTPSILTELQIKGRTKYIQQRVCVHTFVCVGVCVCTHVFFTDVQPSLRVNLTQRYRKNVSFLPLKEHWLKHLTIYLVPHTLQAHTHTHMFHMLISPFHPLILCLFTLCRSAHLTMKFPSCAWRQHNEIAAFCLLIPPGCISLWELLCKLI